LVIAQKAKQAKDGKILFVLIVVNDLIVLNGVKVEELYNYHLFKVLKLKSALYVFEMSGINISKCK
jgi:hypothetical protein